MTDIVERFLAQADRHPERVAISENGRSISYTELRHRAYALASRIVKFGERRKVLIFLDQGWEAYTAILATLIAGGVYAPINTQAPTEKIDLIATQFNPDIVITKSAVRQRFPTLSIASQFIDVEEVGTETLDHPCKPHELMYVMFTSGSTGVPKGVMIARESMSHFIDWVIDTVQPNPDDRWSQHPNIAFDMSNLDIFGCLGSGGALIPFNSPTDRIMPARKIRDEKVTLWYSVPSAINLMLQAKQVTKEYFASLRLMNFAGEALLPGQLEAVFSARPDLNVWNTYGPTEATVTCTLQQLSQQNYRNFSRASVSIGNAISGMDILLVNGPSKDEGEIVITGRQLALGYWQSPELTQKAFRETTAGAERIRGYFTGDWGKRDGGVLYFINRIDNQVKVRGVRIELDEVDAALRRCGYRDAVTVLHEGKLFAFLETDDPVVDEAAVVEKLGAVLLPQAIPSTYLPVKSFPRNVNDKVDRGVLAARLHKLFAVT